MIKLNSLRSKRKELEDKLKVIFLINPVNFKQNKLSQKKRRGIAQKIYQNRIEISGYF